MKRFLPSIFLLAIVGATCAEGASVVFSREVLPILSDKCFQCHGPDEKARKAKLRLDTKEGAFREEDGVSIIKPGDPAGSELFRRITTADHDDLMPPPKSNLRLNTNEIAILKRWIEEGAKWGAHWSFEKLITPAIPSSKFDAQARNNIDRFIFARLEREGLAPSPEAPKETLLRRVSLDLTGLPPTLEETELFMNDSSPDAYDKLVERLLQKSSYGERMAWEWLEAARYADSNGYQGDSERTMWPWRDWVIDAFNRNMPYDQFTIEQLAGDLLPGATEDQRLASGFLRNHMINGEGGRIPEENRVEYVMDMAETTGTVWLGLTFNCSRCHDHKFDPLTKADYYRMFAFFNQTPVDGGGGDPQSRPNLLVVPRQQSKILNSVREESKTKAEAVAKLETAFGLQKTEAESKDEGADKLKKLLQVSAQNRNKNQFADLEKSIGDYLKKIQEAREAAEKKEKLEQSLPKVMVMGGMDKPRETFMLERGLYDKRGEKVSAAVPAFLPQPPNKSASNRLDLARWLVSLENPLMARVTVNRFWQQFFGIGFVNTPGDFGVQGEKPVHPELLDWLAGEFARSGWDVKALCKLIVTSAAYRQSSKVTPELFERDPENRLLARAPRFRLSSWMIRDQALAASGLLSTRVGGPSARPYQPAGVWEDASFGNKRYTQDHGESLYRRSLYTFWRRIIAPPMFFDSASRQVCTVKSQRTNTPLHALNTMNDTTYLEAARAIAQKLLIEPNQNDRARIESIFQSCLIRKPKNEELAILEAAIAKYRKEFSSSKESASKLLALGQIKTPANVDETELAALTMVAATIMNMDEAITKE